MAVRRLLLLAGFCLLASPANATFSAPTQAVFNNACAASSSCAVTVSAIGAGHLLVVLAHIGNTQTLSSVTAAGETFTVVPASGGATINCPFNGGGNTTQVGCAYALKSVGGATTVTCNWSGTASASNTSCGFYEVAFTAPRVYLESNSRNRANGSASTFLGINFASDYSAFINGTNDIIFQLVNVSTGTISAINTSFVLDNNAGQVADAHRLNTFDNTAPTWTNSGAATSIVAALSFGETYDPNTAATIPATTPNSGMQVSYSGSVGTRLVTVISPGLFRLFFDEGDNWGLAGWYDLVNDPGLTTNLLSPACPTGGCGPAELEQAQPGLFNRTYYQLGDLIEHARYNHFFFPNTPRQLSILEYNSARVVIETKSEPAITAGAVGNNMISTERYYIYPNGQIYLHHVSSVTNASVIADLNSNIYSDVTLEDPTQTGTTPPDSQGWIRASATQNPYTNVIGAETYVFAYWGPSTPAPYTGYTKASILLVHDPGNLHDKGQIVHSWGSGVGHGVVRWGWSTNNDTISLGAGGTETEDVLIQLGTQGSTVLPNITSSAVAGPIATAYIANPTPPGPTIVSPPVVNQGATMQFTATDPGTWSCSGTNSSGGATTCAGSIVAGTGVYTAPATVTPQQSIGGFQLHSNNHVFNTRVDSLPLRSDSATLMAGTGVSKLIYHEISFPTNYTDSSTPTVPMSFYYTSGNNANFEIPAYPNAKLETGWFNAITNQNNDHHLLTVNTSTGVLGNLYQYYPACTTTAASVNGSNVATLTCSANPITNGFLTGTNNICVGGFTGADTYFNVCPTSVTAVTSTSISYALTHGPALASTNGSVTKNVQTAGCSTTGTCNSQSGIKFNFYDYALPAGNISTDAAGLELTGLMLRLQEMEQAIATGGTIRHALRMTLQNGFICGSSTANACYSGQPMGSRHIWPATSEAFAGGGLNPYGLRYRLKAAYNCGALSSIAQILCTQLKQYGLILADGGTGWSIIPEAAPWPANIIAAMNEMEAANIVGSTQMEVVDEDGLRISDTSGDATNNREIVTFTRTSDSATATVDVALMGVAVGLTSDVMYIQAGTGSRQLTASVHGGANNTVTWSWSPAITGGTLTSGGLLTAPATIAAKTDTTITATSTDNGAIAASMTVSFFPTGSIYFRPFASTPYTDSQGHVWAPLVLGSGGNLGCCGDHSASNWGSLVDKQIYYYQYEVYGDGYFVFTVPNGSYRIKFKNGSDATVTGTYIDTFEAQGVVSYANRDIFTLTGGPFIAADLTMDTTVTNNQLQIVIRTGVPTPVHTIIEAIQIDSLAPPGTSFTSGDKVTSGVSIK